MQPNSRSSLCRRAFAIRLGCAALLLQLALPQFAGAETMALSEPEGPVLLTVSGDIGVFNADQTAEFDLAMLETLESRTFTTTTIWTEGPQTFTGVTLNALMARLEAEGGTVRALAINDYAIEIPEEDVADGSALLAYHRNGEPMSVRDKGPLWIVFPFDEDRRFRTETYHARSIWQLDRIEVRP